MLYTKYCKKKEQQKIIIIKQSVSLGKTEREREREKRADCYVLSTYGHRLCYNLVLYYTSYIFTLVWKSLVYIKDFSFIL
jgi:hypothetical protein